LSYESDNSIRIRKTVAYNPKQTQEVDKLLINDVKASECLKITAYGRRRKNTIDCQEKIKALKS